MSVLFYLNANITASQSKDFRIGFQIKCLVENGAQYLKLLHNEATLFQDKELLQSL